jgi:rubrerythrin
MPETLHLEKLITMNETIEITCSNCGYNWEYTGNAKRATCPSCGRNNKYNKENE